MVRQSFLCVLGLILMLMLTGCEDDPTAAAGSMQLVSATLEGTSIIGGSTVPSGDRVVLRFSEAIDLTTISTISLVSGGTVIDLTATGLDNNKIIELQAPQSLTEGSAYTLSVPASIRGTSGAAFAGVDIAFTIASEPLTIVRLSSAGATLSPSTNNQNINVQPTLEVEFSHAVSPQDLRRHLQIVGGRNYTYELTALDDTRIEIAVDETAPNLQKISVLFISSLGAEVGRPFATVTYPIFTGAEGPPDFPTISDEALMTLVQERTFQYFWDFGHPASGLARERNTSGNTVTTGGSGFGLMAMIVGVERGFITRSDAIVRWQRVMDFLESADRFHGAWSHWVDGNTGRVQPFSQFDNGGDIVETAFLVQGMLTVRQYLDSSVAVEADLIDQITRLWEGVEWSWYARPGTDYISWHWSPEYEWRIDLPVRGHNETQIIYTLAAASPTYPIEADLYRTGYQRSGNYVNGSTHYGIQLPTGPGRGGPLFFAHYSYIGMDPRNLSDGTIDYLDQNANHTLINRAYCIDNPRNYVGYSDQCWGLTASDGNTGYSAHDPGNDRGVITPTAALSSMPYTPVESMAAMRYFYYQLGDRLWGEYGFYDAFNITEGWVANSYLAIDQGPIVCMIENHRTGLLWDLYMSAPEVLAGLDKLGFTY